MNVRDVMTTSVRSVRPDAPLKEVARQLAATGVSGMPVVDEEGRVIGVVSEADFLLKEQDPPGRRSRPFSWLFDRADAQRLEDKVRATTAGEAMSSPPITIGPEASVREAAALMTRRRVNRLPVVEDGQLVGIVTRADLVGTFLVPDDVLREQILGDVLRDTLWMREDEVAIEVADGVVRLAGTVDRRSTATILERLIGQVEGVVGVESTLGWELDDRSLASVGELRSEPTAASVTARDRPR